MKTKAELLPECPVATTVQIIGNKWKLLIIRNLMSRPWRFNELQRSLDGISQKVLTDNLRSMEKAGIITRTVYAEVPPRVEYALSELGESMRPILDSMRVWGENYKALQENKEEETDIAFPPTSVH
jgi:DNA-binding HxlR family transcriptional regulator